MPSLMSCDVTGSLTPNMENTIKCIICVLKEPMTLTDSIKEVRTYVYVHTYISVETVLL